MLVARDSTLGTERQRNWCDNRFPRRTTSRENRLILLAIIIKPGSRAKVYSMAEAGAV